MIPPAVATNQRQIDLSLNDSNNKSMLGLHALHVPESAAAQHVYLQMAICTCIRHCLILGTYFDSFQRTGRARAACVSTNPACALAF